jgi:TolB-like protein/class 3 adenylate cyclase
MAEDRVDRRLAAILAADVAGYSALMGSDEVRTVRDLKDHQAVVLPMVGDFGGRIIDTAGDGILAEFPSIVNAVECAVAIQLRMVKRNIPIEPERRMQFRIGINFGDVIYDDARIFGDGINIAARLEGISEPGGICVSGKCYEEIGGRVNVSWDDLGEQQLKNITRPVRVYRVRLDKSTAKAAPAQSCPPLTLPDKPSIAVLPFNNMSADPEQEYFADGVVEDIITALSRMRGLFVIARNSSFIYKGRAVDVKQVGQELGVRYVLEGSVRKAGNRLRITGQLINAGTGAHLWADRFDGALEDIFDLQDQITSKVVGAVAPRLEKAEIERAKRKPTESLDAYDYCLRGLAAFHHPTREGIDEALRLFRRAIEIDSDFALPHGMAAWCYVHRKSNGWRTDREQEIAETARLARRAADLGKDDAIALSLAAHALAYVVPDSDIDAATGFADQAVALSPNLATVRLCSGWIRIWRGEPEMAIEHVNHAIRLSPLDPTMFRMQVMLAMAHFVARRYDEASSWAQRALYEQPAYLAALPIAVTSHAQAGRIDVARKIMAEMLRAAPWVSISKLEEAVPFRRRDDWARYAEGMRIAGLPE